MATFPVGTSIWTEEEYSFGWSRLKTALPATQITNASATIHQRRRRTSKKLTSSTSTHSSLRSSSWPTVIARSPTVEDLAAGSRGNDHRPPRGADDGTN